MKIGVEETLPVPPERAFELLSRWEEQPSWMRDADSVRVLGTVRDGPSVRLAVHTRVAGVPLFTEVLEVVAWDPPRRIVVAHRSFVRGTGEWALHPVEGGTLLAWTGELRLPIPALGELALLAYRPLMRRLMRSSLAGLRARCSGPAPQPPRA